MKKSRKKGLPIDEFLKLKEQTVDESSRKSSEKDEEEPNEDDENVSFIYINGLLLLMLVLTLSIYMFNIWD